MAAVFRLARDGKRPLTIRLDANAVVGRGSAAGLRIESRRVSREHCRLTIEDDAVTVRDLGSRNGTAVDGEPAADGAETDVPVGSVLSVGGVELRLIRCGEVTVGVFDPAPADRPRAVEEPQTVEEPRPAKPAAPDEVEPVDDGDPSEESKLADEPEPSAIVAAPPRPEAGDDVDDTVDAGAFGFLGDEEDDDAADENSALKVLPGGDARDQSSFAGFGDPDEAGVDSGLLDFLMDER